MLLLILFGVVVAIYIWNFDTLDDGIFYVFVLIFSFMLWVLYKNNGHTIEGFGISLPTSISLPMSLPSPFSLPPMPAIDNAAYEKLLFALPNKVKDIIIPQFDHVINSLDANKDQDSEKSKKEAQDVETINDADFLIRKDPDVTKQIDKNTVDIDQQKMQMLKMTYASIDKALEVLRAADYDTYVGVLQGQQEEDI